MRIVDQPNTIYVSPLADQPGLANLRAAIAAANQSGQPTTIILDEGVYAIEQSPVLGVDSFPTPGDLAQCDVGPVHAGSSNAATGDLEITGDITIYGTGVDGTQLNGNQLDRLFRVYPGAVLNLRRLSVVGGQSPIGQQGGAILSLGTVTLEDTELRNNSTRNFRPDQSTAGGAIAAWGGHLSVNRSWLEQNESDFGGAIFVCGATSVEIHDSTLSSNTGGAFHTQSSVEASVVNTTFSGNSGGRGAIYAFNGPTANVSVVDFSPDDRFVVLTSEADNLVANDRNGNMDVFIYDRITREYERVSVGNFGQEADYFSFDGAISGNSRYVVFTSYARNLVPLNFGSEVNENLFEYDRVTKTTRLVSVGVDNQLANSSSGNASLSADGRFVVFDSSATNLVAQDLNSTRDIFLYDRQQDLLRRLVSPVNGQESNGYSSNPAISADGRYIAFYSDATNWTGVASVSNFCPIRSSC